MYNICKWLSSVPNIYSVEVGIEIFSDTVTKVTSEKNLRLIFLSLKRRFILYSVRLTSTELGVCGFGSFLTNLNFFLQDSPSRGVVQTFIYLLLIRLSCEHILSSSGFNFLFLFVQLPTSLDARFSTWGL